MTPYYDEGGVTIYQGDALETLRTLPAESAHMCVTSPPYWGLRDYGTAEWEGGTAPIDMDYYLDLSEGELDTEEKILVWCASGSGEVVRVACDHQGSEPRTVSGSPGKQYTNVGSNQVYSGDCRKCGARRIDAQLGLEATPDEYLARMVAVFDEVRRVLRKDATLWLNMGDAYAHPTSGGGGAVDIRTDGRNTTPGDKVRGRMSGANTMSPGLKPKDLIGMPWRLAFALQAAGWYLRSDIIWHKPNPMPESVTDRPTKSHEYIFLLAKSAKYYYDADAIKEAARDWGVRDRTDWRGKITTPGRPHEGCTNANHAKSGRNKRSVWTVPTFAYPKAHFATFPPKLIEPCIKAGCPAGGVVLDPFLGSGTTAMVARDLHCKCVGIELNPEYCEMAVKRLAQGVLEFG